MSLAMALAAAGENSGIAAETPDEISGRRHGACLL
jgi:hypothetical protein